MIDCEFGYLDHPEYQDHIISELSMERGIACFALTDGTMMYASHAFSGPAEEMSVDEDHNVRAFQAIVLQIEARKMIGDPNLHPLHR